MAIRPNKCYRNIKRPYTRTSTRRPRLSYVKGVPQPAIHRFEMGAKKKKFPVSMYLIAKQATQIRHNALEATRITTVKYLNELGKDGFFLKILVYPHHILRENPLATGAGADRFQTGMRKSFGKPIGKAAQIKPGQKLILVRCDKSGIEITKKALKIASSKLPTKTMLEIAA